MEPTTSVEVAKEPSKIVIQLDPTRSKLSEGRSQGIGFAFLKRVGEQSFAGVNPISPCKDYLNDVVYSEVTGRPYRAYGLSTVKTECFEKDGAFLVFASCGQKGCPPIASEVKLLKENLPNMQKLINQLEALMKVEQKTKLIEAGENLIFAHVAPEWVTSSYTISLWAFIARNTLWSGGSDDPFAELAKAHGDEHHMPLVLESIKTFQSKGLPKTPTPESPHSYGIANYPISEY